MSINLDSIRGRLNSLRNAGNRTSNVWKVEPGTHTVRIVPYAHNKSNPFTELYFHYGIGNKKTTISPVSFGRPDPIVEFASKLKSSGSTEDWKAGNKLEPKMRVYAPIIIRGKESEGVKFWSFSKKLYEEILSIIADPDYGDITDLESGRDILVTIKSAEETGKSYPETSIRVKPKETPATTDASVIKLIENCPNVVDSWAEPTYEELSAQFQTYLRAQAAENSDDDEQDSQEVTRTSSVKESLKEFDDLFNKD
ncbi:hypothetical protein [Microcystis phage Mel-JY01]